MNAQIMKLGWKDAGKGFIMAIITAILTGVYTSVQAGQIPTTFAQFQPMLMTGATAGIGYLIKNLATNSKDEFLKAEPVAATDAPK